MAEKSSKTWLLIALGVAVVGGLWLMRQANRISVGGASVRVHKISAFGVELHVDLSIINESRLTIDVYGFLGQIFFKDTAIGVVQMLQPATLAAHAPGSVAFKADISYVSLLTLGLDLAKILKGDVTNFKSIPWADFKIKGTLRAEGFDVPIDQPLLTA